MKSAGVAPLDAPRRRDSASRSMRVGILGHVGNENLGDEAIIAAVIQNIRRRWPDAEINGFTLVPADTEERHGIRSYPIRGGARDSRLADSAAEKSTAPEQPTDTSSLNRMKELVKRIPILSSVARSTLRSLEMVPEMAREVVFFARLASVYQGTRSIDLCGFPPVE